MSARARRSSEATPSKHREIAGRFKMKTKVLRSGSRNLIRHLIAITCATLLVPTGGAIFARNIPVQTAPAAQETAKIPPEQLDSLVAPIALYPDPLLSQALVASTYPLELMQLQQWLERNKNLKDKELTDAVSKQPWDPSIQAMAALPDVVKRLADDIQWTTDLGNAFLAQQNDVMDAIQRMRQKAQGTGALKSNQQQKVETEVVGEKTVIIVEQADPEVIYVPSYNPTVVYGEPYYPYPPIYYPPYTGVVAASAISFGVGLAIGAAWGGGGWGWGCGWGNNDININRNNTFNRNTNISGNRNTWQHNPQHRGGAPYRDRATADRFGGTARGDSLTNRQAGARQQLDRQGGISDRSRTGGDRDRTGGISDRSRTGGDRDRTGGISDRSRTGGDRDRTGGISDRSRTGGDRDRTGGISDRSRTGGGGDRIGNRDIGGGSGGGKSAFGSGGFSGSSARASSSRGSSSFGGSRGGFSRSGGGGRRR
jgi:hypothetical protein